MNRYKLKGILEFLRDKTPLVADSSGGDRDFAGLLACFGLDRLLTADEQRVVTRELSEMAEAEAFMDHLRLTVEK